LSKTKTAVFMLSNSKKRTAEKIARPSTYIDNYFWLFDGTVLFSDDRCECPEESMGLMVWPGGEK
jgi:hypothetical protein